MRREKLSNKGSVRAKIIAVIVLVVICIIIGCIIMYSIKKKKEDNEGKNKPAVSADLILEDNMVTYTVADFQDAILGKVEDLVKLEVHSRELEDTVTITKSGLGNLKVFSKYQDITFKGSVVYTVDLEKLHDRDIVYDSDANKVTVYIPDVEQGEINIPSEDIKFGDVDKGFLAFGDIKMTAEETEKVETEAKQKMQDALTEDNEIEKAREAAKTSVYKLYNPVIKSVSNDATLEIEFDD